MIRNLLGNLYSLRYRGAAARCLLVIIGSAAMFISPCSVLAQDARAAYPSKPIRIVVNFAAGGGVDLIGRIVANGLSNMFGWTTIVDNRPGAGGNIGADTVAKAPADGYTLLVTNGGTLHTNPHIFRAMPFDPVRDFIPITELARIPNLLVTAKSFPANNLPEFLAYLRANPGKVTLATQGTGTTAHISGEMLNSMADVSVVQVPYKGTSAAFPDLVAGRVHFLFDGGASVPYIREGTLKLLAVTSASRLSLFPDTPALNEAGGVPGFVFDSAHTILAPAGTPKEIIQLLNHEVGKVLRTPEVEERLRTMNLEVIGNSPEMAAASIAAEHKRVGDLIKKIGLVPN
jgi:tripartite-type tricarboxylate transporter receptor subunit TctC